MLGNSPLFDSQPSIKIQSDKIIISGHFSDTTRCAKLTMLCEMYGAKVKDGYAELPYSEQFLSDYKKYINKDLKFSITLGIALLLAAIAGGVGIARSATTSSGKQSNEELEAWLKENYPDLTQTQIDAILEQYGTDNDDFWNFSNWGSGTADKEAAEKFLQDLANAYGVLGEQPDAPSESDLDKIMEEAYAEIDAENNRLLNIYNDTFADTKNVLNEELANNNAMFSDYRNQILTNEAMQQQAIAGSTRYELDRQQRNAISRGASAAQRLVTNINTSLGLQAQSAQQALDTSNALAQSLLSHRQAQQGIRNSFLDARNNYNNQVANNISGQTERRFNYGQGQRQAAIDKYNYAYDQWNDKVSNYFQGNSLGEGIYRSQYGNGGSKRKSYGI